MSSFSLFCCTLFVICSLNFDDMFSESYDFQSELLVMLNFNVQLEKVAHVPGFLSEVSSKIRPKILTT